MGKEPEATVLAVDGREVRVSHPDKLYFSREARLTKLDLVRYFLAVAPDRPPITRISGRPAGR